MAEISLIEYYHKKINKLIISLKQNQNQFKNIHIKEIMSDYS